MDIRFQIAGSSNWKGSIMLVFLCKDFDPATIDNECLDAAPWFSIAPGLKDFKADKLDLALFHGHPDLNIPRVLTIGLGEKEKVNLDVLRKAAAAALHKCRQIGLKNVLLPICQLNTIAGDKLRLVEEMIYGSFLGLYRFTQFKTKDKDKLKDPLWLALALTEDNVPDDIHAAARRGEYSAQGTYYARDLANTPPNVLTPETMAQSALKLAKTHQMDIEILDENSMEELGCNAILAVGQGSINPPRLIILKYCPKECKDDKPLVLVGKGITFDSGGICLKPAANMHIMKSDMAGAAAVLGAMHSIATQNISCHVIALLACAENMPSSKAMRPGDVITSYSGKTIEIINTDAEGRLVLCDALSYAQKQYNPCAIVDIATLTGACAIALGQEIAGLFCNDLELSEKIRSLGTFTGEPFWELPLWQPYQELLKSEVADISHMGKREGATITAALFLQEFVSKETPWAHLDIAGTDWAATKSALSPVGAIGFGVRTLIELARNYSNKGA